MFFLLRLKLLGLKPLLMFDKLELDFSGSVLFGAYAMSVIWLVVTALVSSPDVSSFIDE